MKKGIIIKIILILISLFIILFFIHTIVRNIQYKEKLNTLSSKMIESLEKSNTCSNKIKLVWHHSIYKESSEETDPYTKKDGVFYTNFNDALSSLLEDRTFRISIYSIKEIQEETEDLLEELKKPPIVWKNSYQIVKSYYKDYVEIIQLCTNHHGNYQSYSDKVDLSLEKIKEIKEKLKE